MKKRPLVVSQRLRARDLGIRIGMYPPGKYNAITDVPGVQVGHSTIIEGEGTLRPGKGPMRTGVTAILPNNRNIFDDRVVGSGYVLNGAGEISGLTQVMEWGQIETPILLTNTMSVGTCSESLVKYMLKKYPGIGSFQDVVIPVVGECDDSWLNDSSGHHVQERHVFEALDSAATGPVAEGCVGGGTGMITCDFKGGIGTSSRRIPKEAGGYTVGVLVMSNFGVVEDLRVDGIPMGELLAPTYPNEHRRKKTYGSIIAVVATDAPMSSHQVLRLCRRSALGIGRTGSIAAHGSGEIIIGFSNGNVVPRDGKHLTYRMQVMLESAIDPLYRAVIEATEEAVLNALFMADTMHGHSGHVAPGIPLDQVRTIVERVNKYGYCR